MKKTRTFLVSLGIFLGQLNCQQAWIIRRNSEELCGEKSLKKLFLDTDILLDFLGDRKPFSKFALAIFVRALHKDFEIYTSSNSITIAYYILAKKVPEKQARKLILGVMQRLHIISVTNTILRNAFSSEFKDVEDAVQFYSALTVENIDCIITRNLKDYAKSTLPVFSSEEYQLKNF